MTPFAQINISYFRQAPGVFPLPHDNNRTKYTLTQIKMLNISLLHQTRGQNISQFIPHKD